jgi:hypothetical protein
MEQLHLQRQIPALQILVVAVVVQVSLVAFLRLEVLAVQAL